MRVVTRSELESEKAVFAKKMESCLFIYPTDTVYGIGCNAEDRAMVRRLRQTKRQFKRPLSIIAPGKKWIYDNCEVGDLEKEWLEKLPGPYTLIMKLKNKECVAKNVNLNGDTIGVRIPDIWFSKFIEEVGMPIITTSANLTGQEFLRELDDLDQEMKKKVDCFLDVGRIDGKPSKIVDLTKNAEVLRD